MSKLVVTEFMSLDGIVEDLAGEWVGQFDQGPEAGSFKLNETMNSECLLLGRVTYEGFARSWPHEQGEFADKFNSTPKYVVSSTLQDPAWTNTTVLSGDLAEHIAARRPRRSAPTGAPADLPPLTPVVRTSRRGVPGGSAAGRAGGTRRRPRGR